MNLETVYLTRKVYNEYLQGAEVESTLSTQNKNMQPGQHVMVFHDAIASSPAFTVPANRETESIGIEGMVTKVDRVTDLKKGNVEQHLKIKKL
jgi:hypothetical protein